MDLQEIVTRINEWDRGPHIKVLQVDKDTSWVDVINTTSFFTWKDIHFYRKKGTAGQPVTPDEILNQLSEVPDQETAESMVAQLLHKDMAYGVECIPLVEAEKLARAFIALFPNNPKYYTNASWKNGKLCGWSGLTNATFDSGIIVVENQRIGLIWFEDED